MGEGRFSIEDFLELVGSECRVEKEKEGRREAVYRAAG
jgi:hypothetical protein